MVFATGRGRGDDQDERDRNCVSYPMMFFACVASYPIAATYVCLLVVCSGADWSLYCCVRSSRNSTSARSWKYVRTVAVPSSCVTAVCRRCFSASTASLFTTVGSTHPYSFLAASYVTSIDHICSGENPPRRNTAALR